MEKLRNFFEMVGFAGPDLEQILEKFTLETFKKGEYLVKEGKVSKQIGFVESGMFQYFIYIDGEERTTYVNIENSWFASVSSFVKQAPSLENVKAIADSSISLITRENLQQLVTELPHFKDFYISLLEGSICGIDSSRHDLLVLSGEQHYEKLLREEPHLLQQIPLQYLASMLGVTPRHLSRIRANIR